MPYSVALGVPHERLATQAGALLAEDDELHVIGTATDAGALMSVLGSRQSDVAMLHEDIGPLPVMDLAREIASRFPYVAVVLLVKDRTSEILRGALQAGARDVLTLPLSFEELAGVKGAGAWSQMVRAGAAEAVATDGAIGIGGTTIVVAGAKGGVGATTVALHLALEAATQRTRSVCLVDFDLQNGDVGIYLDLTHRRSVADLLQVSQELSGRVLEDALYLHHSGVRVLLAPQAGEQAEDVTASPARHILAALRANFDYVVVDVGATVSEGTAVAVEFADEVVIVATPDVPALRGANRLLAMWERLEIRKEGVRVVLNRTSRVSEIQHDLARRVVGAPVTRASIPAGFRDLEPAINTGVPARATDGSLKAGLRDLADELGMLVAERGGRRKRVLGQSGQVAAETVGIAFLVILVALGLWQMALVGLTYVFAGHSAREGARAMAVSDPVSEAVHADLPGPWASDVAVDEGDDYVEVTLRTPVFVPGIDGPFEVTSRAGAVLEDE
jgi:pilus assembly protein CpaE